MIERLICVIPVLIMVIFLILMTLGMCQAAGRTDAWLDEFEMRQREEALRNEQNS